MSLADRVAVDLERVLAVLQIVAVTLNLRWQLLRLAHRNETRPEVIRERRPEDESARLDPEDRINLLAAEILRLNNR